MRSSPQSIGLTASRLASLGAGCHGLYSPQQANRPTRRFAPTSPHGGEVENLLRAFLCSFCCFFFRYSFVGQAPSFSDAGFFAYLAAQVVQAALADVSVAQDVDLVDAR